VEFLAHFDDDLRSTLDEDSDVTVWKADDRGCTLAAGAERNIKEDEVFLVPVRNKLLTIDAAGQKIFDQAALGDISDRDFLAIFKIDKRAGIVADTLRDEITSLG
jgi:hypothetical protein